MNQLSANFDNDFYEKTRYQLTLRISLLMIVVLSLLSASFLLLKLPVANLSLIGLVISIGLAIYVYLTKTYKTASILFTISGAFLCILTLVTLTESYHFADPLWMLIISLFAYFTLGKTVGNITVLVQFSALVYYIVFNLNISLSNLKPLPDGELYSLAVNIFVCALVIAFLIHQFLKRNAYAAQQYKSLTKELQLKNDLVQKQHNEKTAMLKEIHHRVKNNLQVITSLLRLQSRDMKNEESVQHFKEAIDRIGAMALIHNQMYQSKDLNKIHLEPYLRSLSKNILSSYSLDIPVDISFDIQMEYAPSNALVPIALLFNELASNSLKHAFTDKNRGAIRVQAFDKEDNQMQIIYEDNGDWKTPEKSDSFGLELIETLAEQLNGSVERTIDNGTQYIFILRSHDE